MRFGFDLKEYTRILSECSDEDLVGELVSFDEIISCDNIYKSFLLDILNDVEDVIHQEICKRFKAVVKKSEDAEINVMGFMIRCKNDNSGNCSIVG